MRGPCRCHDSRVFSIHRAEGKIRIVQVGLMLRIASRVTIHLLPTESLPDHSAFVWVVLLSPAPPMMAYIQIRTDVRHAGISVDGSFNHMNDDTKIH